MEQGIDRAGRLGEIDSDVGGKSGDPRQKRERAGDLFHLSDSFPFLFPGHERLFVAPKTAYAPHYSIFARMAGNGRWPRGLTGSARRAFSPRPSSRLRGRRTCARSATGTRRRCGIHSQQEASRPHQSSFHTFHLLSPRILFRRNQAKNSSTQPKMSRPKTNATRKNACGGVAAIRTRGRTCGATRRVPMAFSQERCRLDQFAGPALPQAK